MISQRDKQAIIETAKRYGATRVLLFGSAAGNSGKARDIDLAVEGIVPEEFFNFYGELFFRLSKPVDLIDLSTESKFARCVRREGTPLYVKS